MNKAISFLKEVSQELKKATWLNFAQVKSATMLVLGFVIVIAIYISAVDLGLSRMVGWLLGVRQ